MDFAEICEIKTQLLFSGITVIAGLLLSSMSVVTVPVPSHNGDYIQKNATGHFDWRVVDPDPSELNCRMAKRFQNTDYGSMEAPDELYQNLVHSIGEWSVVTTFSTGELLQVQTTHRTNPIFGLIFREKLGWLFRQSRDREQGFALFKQIATLFD